jgi:hypothetical protein
MAHIGDSPTLNKREVLSPNLSSSALQPNGKRSIV